jgi:hypothetical protein
MKHIWRASRLVFVYPIAVLLLATYPNGHRNDSLPIARVDIQPRRLTAYHLLDLIVSTLAIAHYII